MLFGCHESLGLGLGLDCILSESQDDIRMHFDGYFRYLDDSEAASCSVAYVYRYTPESFDTLRACYGFGWRK